MGLVTLADLRSDLVFDLENRSDLLPAQLDRWINSAYSWMCQPRVRRHQELSFRYDSITLATGVGDYSISSATVGRRVNGIRSVVHYLDTTIVATGVRRKLRPRSVAWFYERTSPPGAPTIYIREGDTLITFGVPTSAENGQKLRVVYWGEPTPLTVTTQATAVGNYFDRVLRKAALAFAMEDLGYRDLALEARQEAVALVNEVPDDGESDDDSGQENSVEVQSYQ